MSNALKVRLARLERQTQERRWPKVCSGVYDSEADLIGIGDGASNHLERQPGESLEQLSARAFATFGNVKNLAALYAPRLAPEPPQRDLSKMPMPTPETAPRPFVGIPGVGRIASLAELQQMGAIVVPPERLIN